jgi:hypothetical protein
MKKLRESGSRRGGLGIAAGFGGGAPGAATGGTGILGMA